MLKGLIFFCALVLGALSGLILLTPSVMLLCVHSRRVISWRRRYTSFVTGLYFDFAAAVLTKLMGTKVFIYSDSRSFLRDKGPMIIICNHRTRVDWMFGGWCYAFLINQNPELRMILKESLRSVPIFGWCMQIMMYIFLTRKRDIDVPYMRRMISYLLNSGCSPILFLFPEGTDLSDSNIQKSNTYARERNLPELSYVLYPKLAGLLTCISTLKEAAAEVAAATTFTGSAPESVKAGNAVLSSADPSSSSAAYTGGSDHPESLTEGGAAASTAGASTAGASTAAVRAAVAMDDNSALNPRPPTRGIPSTNVIHDLTIAYRDYKDGVRTSDKSILAGCFPREVHIKVDRFDLDAIPFDKHALEEWLRQSFYRKELLLRCFYEGAPQELSSSSSSPSSSSSSSSSSLSSSSTTSSSPYPTKNGGAAITEGVVAAAAGAVAAAAAAGARVEGEGAGGIRPTTSIDRRLGQPRTPKYSTADWPNRVDLSSRDPWKPLVVVSVWIAVTVTWLYLYSWFRWVAVCMTATCIAVRMLNGFDSVELALHGPLFARCQEEGRNEKIAKE